MHHRKYAMKRLACLSLLMTLPITATYSADNTSTKKLAVQKVTAEPAHLTTRIQWIKYPQVQYKSEDLENLDRSAIIRIRADETGKVIATEIQESTGLKALDQKLVNAVHAAKVKPYIKNGTALEIIGYQTFTLKMDDSEDKAPRKNECTYTFSSKNWLKQEKNKSVPFEYQQQPQLKLDENLLKNQDRLVKFKFKVDKHGDVSNVQLKKRSGVNALDQQVIEAVSNAKVTTRRSYKTLWIYKKSTLNDQIEFKVNKCQ